MSKEEGERADLLQDQALETVTGGMVRGKKLFHFVMCRMRKRKKNGGDVRLFGAGQ